MILAGRPLKGWNFHPIFIFPSMASFLKGAGLLGAGAYGYHQVSQSDTVSNLKNLAGILGDGSRGGVGGAASAPSTSGGEVGP